VITNLSRQKSRQQIITRIVVFNCGSGGGISQAPQTPPNALKPLQTPPNSRHDPSLTSSRVDKCEDQITPTHAKLEILATSYILRDKSGKVLPTNLLLHRDNPAGRSHPRVQEAGLDWIRWRSNDKVYPGQHIKDSMMRVFLCKKQLETSVRNKR
jgi:hypothetical protein